MHSRRIPRWTLAALLTIPAFGAGLAVSAAASGTISTTFYACLHKGTLSKVSTSSHACKSGKLESWNAAGPQGIQGVRGIQGGQGVQGVQGLQGVQGAPGPTSLSALSGSPCTIPAYGRRLPIASVLGVYINPLTGATDMMCLGGQASLVVSPSVDPTNPTWGAFSGSGLEPGADVDVYVSVPAAPTIFFVDSISTVLSDGTTSGPDDVACGSAAAEYVVSTTYGGNPIGSATVAAPC